MGGYAVPAGLLTTAVIAASGARLLGRAVRRTLLVSLPVLVSVLIVSVFFRPGSTVLFELGPVHATLEGLDVAIRICLRLLVAALALVVFGMTTDPRALIADLERRGLPRRLTFAIAAALDAVPAMVERARTVTAAQRARGLDTEGSVGARLRGIRPLVGPVVLSALAEVEERSLALEARGFDRAGHRALLWAPADSPAQRRGRWLMVGGLLAVVVAQAAGVLAGIP